MRWASGASEVGVSPPNKWSGSGGGGSRSKEVKEGVEVKRRKTSGTSGAGVVEEGAGVN